MENPLLMHERIQQTCFRVEMLLSQPTVNKQDIFPVAFFHSGVPRQSVTLLAEDTFSLPCSFFLWSASQLLGLLGLKTEQTLTNTHTRTHTHWERLTFTHTYKKHPPPQWISRPFIQPLSVLKTPIWPSGASDSCLAPLSHINTLSTHPDMLCQWNVPPYQIFSGWYWCEGTRGRQ